MQFVSDPNISDKINQMKRRVRWQESLFKKNKIDQTKLAIDSQSNRDNSHFSFLVIGDSGCGSHLKHHPQRRIMEMMLKHHDCCSFVLHTGDVVYQVGSSEYYPQNFIEPYKEFLLGGEKPSSLEYDSLVFKLPFLPVLGNHDYYNLPLLTGILAQATWLPRRLLRGKIDLDVGWHGSDCGNAYAKAFLDYLITKNGIKLEQHLEKHYTAQHRGDRCISYQPGKFTRLPNRYYTFSYGGIDFFALDSNTFNQPLAIPDTEAGKNIREGLLNRQQKLESREREIQTAIDKLDSNNQEEAEQIDDYYAKLEHIAETQRDIAKQLNKQEQVTDWEQLTWLKENLVASWQDETIKGRIVFLHHPPYVTETTKWNQGQTLAVRDRLRQVFDDAIAEIDGLPPGRSIVDLVLSGHAHCLEHLYTKDTGYGDSHIDWIVCGGSGHSLRRQRREGTVLFQNADLNSDPIGQSQLYVGRNGSSKNKKRPYSFLRIDVEVGERLRLTINPYVAEWHRHQWYEYAIEPFIV